MNDISKQDIVRAQRAMQIKNGKSEVKLLVIDLRNNGGGKVSNVHKLLNYLTNSILADYYLYMDQHSSLEPEYRDDLFQRDLADIINAADLTDKERKSYIQQLKDDLDYDQYLYAKNKKMKIVQNTNRPELTKS